MVPEKMVEAKRNGLRLSGANGPKILARSFYRELRDAGFAPREILAASSELLELVTQELRGEDTDPEA
ncbi:hypothetical protein [Vulgatibacter incomptus]|uniref:Uncharacterized protein n=1 Tax=Vulgatibacter incomptus TaxID=1391653 RepID=A0A0K1PAC8_9BACT|nr:hypothetical protein [Vulgatibacter incomptus]AKU90457.1 hypothetical protein AKJ08_0844 [Vulgatibacter incomptus]